MSGQITPGTSITDCVGADAQWTSSADMQLAMKLDFNSCAASEAPLLRKAHQFIPE